MIVTAKIKGIRQGEIRPDPDIPLMKANDKTFEEGDEVYFIRHHEIRKNRIRPPLIARLGHHTGIWETEDGLRFEEAELFLEYKAARLALMNELQAEIGRLQRLLEELRKK